jgi:hypothetical protein
MQVVATHVAGVAWTLTCGVRCRDFSSLPC